MWTTYECTGKFSPIHTFSFIPILYFQNLKISPIDIVLQPSWHIYIYFVHVFMLYCLNSFLAFSVSADNLCKQFGPRSGPTFCLAWFGFKLFDTLMVFLKEFFNKIDIEKKQQTTKNIQNFLSIVNELYLFQIPVNCVHVAMARCHCPLICSPQPIARVLRQLPKLAAIFLIVHVIVMIYSCKCEF